MRTITPTFALALVLLLTAGSIASADWQYTHWGMTVEEVIAASAVSGTGVTDLRRVERPSPDRGVKGDPDAPKTLLRGMFAAGRLRLRVNFLFREGRLAMVSLVAEDEVQGAELERSVRAKYGTPTREERGDSPETTWRNEAGNVEIGLGRVDVMHWTVVSYRPLKTAETDRL